jgi:hypothetical protein
MEIESLLGGGRRKDNTILPMQIGISGRWRGGAIYPSMTMLVKIIVADDAKYLHDRILTMAMRERPYQRKLWNLGCWSL